MIEPAGTVESPPFREDLDLVTAWVGERWQGLAGGRLFLTGGTGFVGKWLLATLIHANYARGLNCRVTILSRKPRIFARQHPELAHDPMVELVEGDITDFRFPPGRFTHVIHGAADVVDPRDAIETLNTAIDGTRRVLDFAVRSGASRMMLLSSGSVYGIQPAEMSAMAEDFPGTPDPFAEASAYGLGKRYSEWLAVAATRNSTLQAVIARGFAFVGPYLPLDRHFAVGNFIRDAMHGQPIVIQGDGTPMRTYLYAADMAAWLWTILLEGKSGSAYNVGGNTPLSIRDLAQTVAAVIGSAGEVVVQVEAHPGKPIQRYVPDVRKACDELGLSVETGLDDSIRKTAAWYRGQEHLR